MPEGIADDWLHHVDNMRHTITRDRPGQCTTPELPITAGTRFKIMGS